MKKCVGLGRRIDRRFSDFQGSFRAPLLILTVSNFYSHCSRDLKFLKTAFVAFFSLFLALGSLDSLQLVAWTGMLMSFSKTESIQEAVSKTFDGEHPCELCETVSEARKSTETSPEAPGEKRENKLQRMDLFQPSTSELTNRKAVKVPEGPRGTAALLADLKISLLGASPPPRSFA